MVRRTFFSGYPQARLSSETAGWTVAWRNAGMVKGSWFETSRPEIPQELILAGPHLAIQTPVSALGRYDDGV